MSKNTEAGTDWFGVKLLHKITISGMPKKDKMDKFYHDIHEFFEESIILVKAASFDEAFHLAESEAQKDNDVYTLFSFPNFQLYLAQIPVCRLALG